MLWQRLRLCVLLIELIIYKLIRIQHEKKHGKGSKNSSAYFDNKMIEEEEMEKQIDDGTFDECAYVKDDDDLCA